MKAGCIGYLRVSTERQDADNQRAEIAAWAGSHNLGVPQWTSEQASTKTHWRQRSLHHQLESAHAGDTLIAAEVSRLARSTLEVLEILQYCASKGIHVHVVKSALILDGSMQSRIVVTVLALAAEIEREFIRARTVAALDARRAKGLPMGRPRGSKSGTKIDGKTQEIERLLAAGVPMTAVARLLGVSRGTVNRWKSSHTTKELENV